MRYDIHCHLDKLDDAEKAVKNAEEARFSLILTNGTGPEDNRRALALAQQYPIVEAALGLYPDQAVELTVAEQDAELAFIREHDPVAIGEVGLDYHWDDAHQDEMRALFSKIVGLAEELDRPVLIHSRKAESDVLDMLEGREVTACLHCFGGSLKLARRAIAMDCYFSIPATVVRATHFQRLVEEVPLDRLLTETDSPYLSPDRESSNEPANAARSAEKIAEIKGISVADAERALWLNACRFLALDADGGEQQTE